MKLKLVWKRSVLLSVLAAGLVFVPLPGLADHSAAAAASKTAAQADVIPVFVDGTKLALTPSPVTIKGTTIVPMRTIFNALKASVTWEPATKTIIVVKDRTTITLQLGSSKAVKNGKNVTLAVPPQMIKGATMVPLRFVAEALGAEVKLDSAARVIRITSFEALQAQAYEDEAEADDPDSGYGEYDTFSTEEVVEMNDDKVVMITTDSAQGSGVIIGPNRIVTNLHVMQEAGKATVLLRSGDTFEVEGIVGYDEKSDLAVIQTTKPLGVEPATIGYGVGKGAHVIAIGSPLGLQNTVSDGIISNLQQADGVQTYQISAPIDHGSSGGGLFDDYGELIGITSSGIESTQADLNFAVSVLNVSILLYNIEDNKANEKIDFLPSTLPDTLVGATDDDIRDLVDKEFGEISTSQGGTKLQRIEVKRDDKGWLVVSAVIDPAFYMLYGNMANDDLRFWALDAGTKLHKLLPDDTIQLAVYYEQEFSFEPRNLNAAEVTAAADGKWLVRYPVVQLQGKEKMIVQVRT
ncbi:stalk domain-containing protein [Paenibacillus sepulcri]|uniref:Trypsin-like peptidase domain-containing protein n=1 Tax=Paenibacillus sepulcri TaxID=359917 RepID=A0ABS7C7Y7_9BACL|nr:trypsin-like peptidase domain-containing protein [Paenibacillus sepulcri]